MASSIDDAQKRAAVAAKNIRFLMGLAEQLDGVMLPGRADMENTEWAVEALETFSRYGNLSEAFGVKAPRKNKTGIKSAANKNAEGRQERDTEIRDLWCLSRMLEAVKQAELSASQAAAKGEKIKVVITEIIKGVASDIAQDEEFKLKAGIGEPPSVSLLMKIWGERKKPFKKQ